MIIKQTEACHVPALKALWQQAFEDGEAFADLFFRYGFHPDRSLAAFEGDKLLGALYWFDCSTRTQRLAYLYGVAVERAHRSRGVGKALMTRAHAHLAGLGYDGCVLVPAEKTLFSYYGALGYQTFSGMERFTCPAGEAIPLRWVEEEEYARLRKQYLPENAVFQEGEMLTFLASYCGLYAGEDVLAAVYAEGEKIYVSELLGDREKAPGIAAHFGCREGQFRIPGTEPFAMYLPLNREEVPAYFGLALD